MLLFLDLLPALHLFEILAIVINLTVLLSQYLLVIIQESLELIDLRFFEQLEPIESCCDLIRRRNLGHLGDRLVQQMMLGLRQCLVVAKN